MDKDIDLSEKDELLRKIKNLAIDPIDYLEGKELLMLMDYYGVHGLMELNVEQLKEYYEKRTTKTVEGGTTSSS